MSTNRLLVLVVGPLVLVAGAYWVTFGLPGTSSAAALESATTLEDFPRRFTVEQPRRKADPDKTNLASSCRRKANEWKLRLKDSCSIIVQSPLVIIGPAPEPELQNTYRKTILPIYRAVLHSYSHTRPDRPITIFMLNTPDEYRLFARKIDNYDALRYHGYYLRKEDRIVLDASSGNGTLAHELTHALLAFDFPNAPEWFDEGLASLHEQCEFSTDGDTLIGLNNWRLGTLGRAAQNRQLQPLGKLIRQGAFRGEGEGLHYAEVRYLCLYLQRRGLLRKFYHEFRDSVAIDPHGLDTLCRVLEVDSITAIDEGFRVWLRKEFHQASRIRASNK